jgi:4-amino-4-deoxy-L-arabinose transferase-like glycosyltransferase
LSKNANGVAVISASPNLVATGETSTVLTSRSWQTWIVICLILAAYTVFRVNAIPADPMYSGGFCHDCSYLSIVGKNLHEGRGFVLSSLWLVFLQPASLPMPYHNGNPLFPILIAGAMAFGLDAVRAGFLISAMSATALVIALLFLLRRHVKGLYTAFAIAFLVALFPQIWAVSWDALTDGLWLVFMIAFVAALERSGTLRMTVLAGLFLGLSWLTRSATTAVMPGVVALLWMAHGWKKGASRLAMLGFVAAAVASPWLIHTARVWGSPLRSDNGIVMGAYVNTWKSSATFNRETHRPVPPPPYTKVLLENPGVFLAHYLAGFRPAVRELIRSTTDSDYVAAAVLALLATLIALYSPGTLRTPGFLGTLVYGAIFLAFEALGGAGAEGRYYILLQALFAAWLYTSLFKVWQEVRAGRRDWLCLGIVALWILYGAILLPRHDYELARDRRAVAPQNMEYMRMAERVNRDITNDAPVIVGDHAYYYTISTGAQALSIPESGDDYLRSYMKKYHVNYIFLSDAERQFWKPSWTQAGGLPQFIRLRANFDKYHVYQKTDAD